MKYPVDLLTNGMIDNYPKKIYMSTFKIRHFRELLLARKVSKEAFRDSLTAVYDSLIDFSRTGYITSSSQLTPNDRKKIYIWQKINTKGSAFTMVFTCPKCKEPDITNDFSLNDCVEIKLTKKVKFFDVNIYKDGNEKNELNENHIILNIGVPVRDDYKELKNIVDNYKVKAFKELDKYLYIEKIKDLEKEKKELKKSDNAMILEKLREKTNNRRLKLSKGEDIKQIDIEINKAIMDIKGSSDINIAFIDATIENLKSKIEENSEEIKKILKKYNFEETLKYYDEEDFEITSLDDLVFDDELQYDLTICTCIKNKDIINDYIEFVLDLPLKVKEDLTNFMKSIYHNIEDKVKYVCTKCGHSFTEELDIDETFFLN